MEKRYTVGQASAMTGVKYYVMRYWEEELELKIGRNELGHRYYTAGDIRLFMNINELKNRGLQLKAIKQLIPQLTENTDMDVEKLSLTDEAARNEIKKSGRKTEEREVEICTGEVCRNTEEESVSEAKMREFRRILEKLIHEEIQRKETGEYRCRSLDESIRRHQMARRESAATENNRKRNKKISCR